MKILLLFPMADRQTGPGIKYAFEQLGHEVKAVDAKRHPLLSYSIAYAFRPDLIFCSRTKELTEQVTSIKKKFANTMICMWNVDTRNSIQEWDYLFPLIKLCDYYFVVASKLIPDWQKINPNTHWLPQGLQEEVYHKPREITDEDRKKYCCDISWAGTARKQRRPFLNAIDQMNINFKYWGCRGVKRIYDEKHNKMVSLSRINLCCSGWPENEAYTSVRNYKVMGAGGFALELNRTNLEDIFPMTLPGLMGTYVSVDDLIQRIRFWLDHEKERKEIAERAYKWIHENATYTHRMKKALEIMRL